MFSPLYLDNFISATRITPQVGKRARRARRPRRSKLRIFRFRASTKAQSLRCFSSPHKAVRLCGVPKTGERETHRGQPWQAASCRPIRLDTQCSAINGGPTKWPTLWGKEKQTERLSFRACAEAKDTQFVSTQDRLPWLGLKAVKTPSTSCESCQALSALFPIAGARAANTAETISKEWSVYVRKQKILLHEAQGKFLHQ